MHWDNLFSQDADNGKEVWGRLVAKHKSFHNVDLTNDTFVAGRALNCNYSFKLQAPEIKDELLIQMSKQHFKISRDLAEMDSPVYIEDLSRNGTFVNEEKIGLKNKRILAHGDTISIAYPKMKAFIFRNYHRKTDVATEIAKKYYVSKKLGSGTYGTVFLVYEYRTCQKYALKQIKKKQLIDYRADESLNEAKIMQSLRHPCIVQMYDVVDSSDSVFITLELMKGGELKTRIRNEGYLKEANAKLFFYQMCHAIKYLHERKITHRDLKPGNILLASSEENTLLKISDFGLSKLVKSNTELRTVCGTPMYVAPEIFEINGEGTYTVKVDIWSLGVVLFTMLSGSLPFADDNGRPAIKRIKQANFTFSSQRWNGVSNTAKNIIRKMLTTNVNKRPSIDQLLLTKWFKDGDMIEIAHKLMNIPMPHHYASSATRSAIQVQYFQK